MTGLVNSVASMVTPAASSVESVYYPESKTWIDWNNTDPLQAMSQKLNLGSMSLDLFAGGLDAYGKQMQAKQEAYALGAQAKDQQLQAKGELIRGQEASNDILDNAIQTIAAQKLAYAVNGMDVNFGTPMNTRENTARIAERQTGRAGRDAAMAALTRRKQAAALMEQRANVLSTGGFQAAAAIGRGFVDSYRSQQDLVTRSLNRG